ncbi:MAG: C2H2-type zinc finger protein, partial [Candidatus Nanopelagicaceae bacterium]
MENLQAPEAPIIRCPICYDTFSRNFTMKRHMVRIHGYTYEEYIAHNSNDLIYNSNDITHNSHTEPNNSHLNIKTITSKEYKCIKCFKCFDRNWSLRRHMEKCKGIKDRFSCEYCNSLFSHEKSRFGHYKICKAKKEVDSKALVPISTENIPVGSTINNSQIATNI